MSRVCLAVLFCTRDLLNLSLLYTLSVNYSASPSPDICVALFYRPPNSNSYFTFRYLVFYFVRYFISLTCIFFLIGDFNIEFLTPSSLYTKLLSVISSFNLTQVVSEPTRVSNTYSSLIDLIFVPPSVTVKSCSTMHTSSCKCRSPRSAPRFVLQISTKEAQIGDPKSMAL